MAAIEPGSPVPMRLYIPSPVLVTPWPPIPVPPRPEWSVWKYTSVKIYHTPTHLELRPVQPSPFCIEEDQQVGLYTLHATIAIETHHVLQVTVTLPRTYQQWPLQLMQPWPGPQRWQRGRGQSGRWWVGQILLCRRDRYIRAVFRKMGQMQPCIYILYTPTPFMWFSNCFLKYTP